MSCWGLSAVRYHALPDSHLGINVRIASMQKNPPASSRKLKLIPLVAATYFMVAGGPYGLEQLVQTSGYKLGLLIVLLVPLVWSLPTALMVGELSAAIPCD